MLLLFLVFRCICLWINRNLLNLLLFSGLSLVPLKTLIWNLVCEFWRNTDNMKKEAAFRGMHVSPAKHSYASVTDRRTDGRTTDKVIPMCRFASQATQKWFPFSFDLFHTSYLPLLELSIPDFSLSSLKHRLTISVYEFVLNIKPIKVDFPHWTSYFNISCYFSTKRKSKYFSQPSIKIFEIW